MTNLIILLVSAILTLLVIKYSAKFSKAYMSADGRNFDLMIEFTMLYCLAVIVFVSINGTFEPWSRILLHISNMFKIEAMTTVTFVWLFFVLSRLKIEITKVQRIIIWLPYVIVTILLLTNPVTSAIFDIDFNNLYSRCTGIYFHWGVSFLYMSTAFIITLIWAYRTPIRAERKKIFPLIACPIIVAIGALFQIIIYGTYTTQIGLTIGLAFVYISSLLEIVCSDYLTGLNNRQAMDKYIAKRLAREEKLSLTVMIFDVNHFKYINDKKGVKTGDKVLVTASECLMSACEEIDEKLFLCRKGNDDFVLIAPKMSIDRIAKITSIVRRYANIANDANTDYKVAFSIGTEVGDIVSTSDFDMLLSRADKRLEEEKTRAPAY